MMIVDHDITAVCITEGFSCAATETLIIATTNYVITDADVGRVLPITDGFLTNLTMTAPPPVYEVPSFDEGKQIWTAGYFVLRGSGDYRDTVCINPRAAAASLNGRNRTPTWSSTAASAFVAA